MTFDEIQKRAKMILQKIEDNIEMGHDLDCPDLLNAYLGISCLALRDLNLYKKSFKNNGLFFDINSVEVFYEKHSNYLEFGYKGLTYQERSLLNEAINKLENDY